MLFLISLACLALYAIVILNKAVFKPGVRQIPGPFLAKFTDLLRTYYAYRGILFQKQQEWHRRYGNYVRIGPNTVMVSESDVFQGVFGARKEFPKVSGGGFTSPRHLRDSPSSRVTFRNHGGKFLMERSWKVSRAHKTKGFMQS